MRKNNPTLCVELKMFQSKINIKKRPVKHARVRVSEDNLITFIVPDDFTEKDVISLQNKKAKWIFKQLSFFNLNGKVNFELGKNEILFYGYPYKVLFDLNENSSIDRENKIIRHNKDLLYKENQINWYKRIAKEHIKAKVDLIAKIYNLNYNKLFIRSQYTKWGNCSPKKNISLNWKIIKMPDYVQNYLITHELLHTKIMNHTQAFWMHLSTLIPEYKKAVNWLHEYGRKL